MSLNSAIILARAVSFTDDGDCTLLAFADDPDSPVNYLMLAIANEPDEQEIKLGLDGLHIDAGALGINGYDLVQTIREMDDGIVVSLSVDAARAAGIGREIEIQFAGKKIDGIPVDEIVRRFTDRLQV